MMTSKQQHDEILQKIAQLESQRDAFGEAVVAAGVAVLRSQLAALSTAEAAPAPSQADVMSGITLQPGESFARLLAVYASDAPATYHAALTAYLRHLLTNYHTLNLRGIRTERLLTIELEQVFVTLSALDPRQEAQTLRRKGRLDEKTLTQMEGQRSRPVPELLAEVRRLVVLGAPGSGKTTLLTFLTLTCARALAEGRPDLVRERLGLPAGDVPLPIFLPLREFAAYLRGLPDHLRVGGGSPSLLLDYLSGYFSRWELKLPADFFLRQLEAGHCLLLFDGLDEVADSDERTQVSEHVTGFVHRFADNRFVLTCRVRGYTGAARLGADFLTCTVLDFDEADIERFISNWTLTVEVALANGLLNDTVRANAALRRAELLQGVLTNQRVRDLAVNPLLLTVIALVHQYRAKLPENRAELYNECTEVLLGYWETGKPGEEGKRLARYTGTELSMNPDEKRAFIEPLAFAMQERGLREIDKADLLAQVGHQFAERGFRPDQAKLMAADFLETLVLRSGLLREIEIGVFQFLHLTFQEYLAARVLADRPDFAAFARARVGEAWWKEVILLTAAHLGNAGRTRVSHFVGHLLGAGEEGTLLAGECLVDVGRHKVLAETWQAGEQALLDLMVAAGAGSLANRAAAGRSLGWLGDPREGVTTLPPLLTPVMQGKFIYSEKDKAEERDTAPFQAGVYPVTNAQSAQFMAAGGYASRQWWSQAGWQWRQGEPQYDWQKTDQPDFWHDRRYNVPNQPVVGVTWYEAEAFCNWLTETFERVYRLPTETEWERLARGEHGRVYPWGNSWEVGLANTREGEIGQTSAVGLFPGGVSPTGALDCAGNVWEWCLNWSDEKEQMYRVLRGGSWFINLNLVRCASRNGDLPHNSNFNYGFRLVSPI